MLKHDAAPLSNFVVWQDNQATINHQPITKASNHLFAVAGMDLRQNQLPVVDE